jgi:hypothetical protein
MVISEGVYRGRIRDYGIVKSQAGNQHPTVFIDFTVIGRYNAATGELESCPEVRRSYFRAITERTVSWLLSDLKTIGYDRPGFQYFDPEVPGAVDLFNREIDVDCEHETYNGQPRERWSIHRKRNRDKVGRGELSKLDAIYADKLKRILGSSAPTIAPDVTETNTDEAQ